MQILPRPRRRARVVRGLTLGFCAGLILLISFHALAVRIPRTEPSSSISTHSSDHSASRPPSNANRFTHEPIDHNAPSSPSRSHEGGCEFCHGGAPITLEVRFALLRPVTSTHNYPDANPHGSFGSQLRLPPPRAPPLG
ncbi:MAG: hypothetical protein HC933_14405 [Pleurocapsa sp. SU_196_0]|nr:hypothetical protein [Pleurocapsa sp. SU_196_0]